MTLLHRSNLLVVVLALAGAGAGMLLGGFVRAPLPPVRDELPVLTVGTTRPDASRPDLEGRSRSLDEWNGKLLLLNFWASWCAPCRREMPLLDGLQQRHAGRGLQVLGVAVDEAAAVRAFLAEHPVAYPILLDEPGVAADGDLSIRFGDNRSVLPYSVLVGRDGRVIDQHFGDFSEPALAAWVEPHLD